MIKIMMMDTLYIEADRNYSHIFTKEKEYLLSVTLKNIDGKLTQPFFMRIQDNIMNKGKRDQFNETNFSPTVIFHMASENVVGIADARTYYGHFLTGFSNIKFEIKEGFGQGNKLTKHWVFSGVHTGDFFGIAATGKSVKLEGSTIVRMENGIIMKEQDFFDNLDSLTQLGVY